MNRRTSAWVATHAPTGTRWGQKVLSLLLSLALCLTLLPGAALADDTGSGTTAPSSKPLTQEILKENVHKKDEEDGKYTNDGIYLPAGSYYLEDDISLLVDENSAYPLIISGAEVTLDLRGHVLDLKGQYIDVSRRYENGYLGNTLTLTDSNPENLTHQFRVEDSGLWVLDEASGAKTVTGGVITGGKKSGVWIQTNSTFNMNGGSIVGCTTVSGSEYSNSEKNGGGVYSQGTFTMESGSRIEGCTAARYGGGVYVSDGTTFIMNGGRIEGCTAAQRGGGVYVESGDKQTAFTMNGGSIEGCTADENGGGVYNNGERSRFTMSGGSIMGCTAANGGGVYSSGAFTMESGSRIEDCTADENGGGVYASSLNAQFNGGTISGCSAANGGGVYNSLNFTMEGGSIERCTAAQAGGGVYIDNDKFSTGNFTMDGGSISNCKANGADNSVHADGTFTDNNNQKIDKSLLTGINAGDAGTSDDPIRIASVAGLENFRNIICS